MRYNAGFLQEERERVQEVEVREEEENDDNQEVVINEDAHNDNPVQNFLPPSIEDNTVNPPGSPELIGIDGTLEYADDPLFNFGDINYFTFDGLYFT